MPQLSPFGHKLRAWRHKRGVSQLALAAGASTTARHVSFIETGRSRPGRDLVLRLAEALAVPVRDRNALLRAAGLAPVFPERDLDARELRPFTSAVEAILSRHDPFPACAMDLLGRVHSTNVAFGALWPGATDKTPEEGIDDFFGAGAMREMIENWAEVAWAYVDSRRAEAAKLSHAQLHALAERAAAHLDGVPRPPVGADTEAGVICPRFRIGDQVIRTFTTVMRFEHPLDVTLSELRVELVFPMDDASADFFRGLQAG